MYIIMRIVRGAPPILAKGGTLPNLASLNLAD
jgi:hypothetical protein